ncbi:trypsin-like serine peptidase [Planctomycetes bacterium K23_9]|uniref:Serine protease n=1 Tax=Stieleria marina TaxID=1930275 RepID=A0A517NUK0_9BACT|nr:Glutamyl endopeptidase precursor [Planctomycetes bacterium K23_9]
MYFQISASIAESHSDFQPEIEFVDAVLDEAETTSTYRAEHLARISRLDLARIEAVLDMYADEDALTCVETFACENCQTLASLEEIEDAIQENGVFECSRCNRQFDQAEYDPTAALSVYYFDPESVERVPDSEIRQLIENAAEPAFDLDQDSFLEEATGRNRLLKVSKLVDWLRFANQRICRVRYDGDDFGTGFLIADDLVLTCHHVVKDYLAKSDREFLSVCFDAVGETEEAIIPVDPSWDIPNSEPSESDERGTDTLPGVDQLDFAILKLNTSVGEQRGAFSITETRRLPRAGNRILIAGHPGPNAPLQPLMFSMPDDYIGENENGTRMIYKTSTLKGSSGSPVFDRKYRLIGLHHNRGEEGETFFKNNRGVPTAKIASYLKTSRWNDLEEIRALLGLNEP